jgi:GTP cyclohydrolase I
MNIDHLRSNGHILQVEREPKRVDYPRLLELGRELLLAIGEDANREGLRETPRRWAETYFTIE